MNSYSKEHYTTKVGKPYFSNLVFQDFDEYAYCVNHENLHYAMKYEPPVWFVTIYPEPRSSMDEWDNENAIQAIKIAEEKLHHLFVTLENEVDAIQKEETKAISLQTNDIFTCLQKTTQNTG